MEFAAPQLSYAIRVSTDGTGSGTVTLRGAAVSGYIGVAEGAEPIFLFTPSSNSAFDGLRIDDNAVDAGYNNDLQTYYYHFDPVTDNHTVLVIFTKTSSGDSGSDSGSDSGDPSYPITLSSGSSDLTLSGGTVKLSKTNARLGDTVILTPEPEKGYELIGLTAWDARRKEVPTTKIADGRFSFKMPSGTVSVTPSFSKIQYYTDVTATAYYADAAWLLRTEDIMLGTSNTIFSGSDLLNRQQTWMIAARMSGYAPADMTAAKEWAVSANVSDGSNAIATVSRQQLVVMLYRAAGSPDVAESKLLAFFDGSVVADYAKDAMAWAVDAEILKGNNGRLNPADPATRGNAAMMFTRYLDAIQK